MKKKVAWTILAIAVLVFGINYFIHLKRPKKDVSHPPSVKPQVGERQAQLNEAERQYLIAVGLKNPESDLVQDLMAHNELIPCKGVLGGIPGFYNADRILIQSKDRVLAEYDDGHVVGSIELSFSVSNGKIMWKVLKANCAEE